MTRRGAVLGSAGEWGARAEAYGPHAGAAGVEAARRGDLELRAVSFSYPLRPDMPGALLQALPLQWRQDELHAKPRMAC